MTSVDLAALPDVSFAPLDPEKVERDVIASFENSMGITLYPAVPERLLCESLAYRETVVNGLIDLAARQLFLAYASGGHLDHHGALLGVCRLPAGPSQTTVRFFLNEPLPFLVEIPAGTRVATAGGDLLFSTDADATIAVGVLETEVVATCMSTGAATNGFVPGQVSKLVDRLPHVSGVVNVTMSLGGSDTETDDHFRERIQMAPEAFSNAGSAGVYRFWAMSAHADIADVAVNSPTPGVVDIRPVLLGGEMPNAVHLSLVAETLNAETVRPLTDQVLVAPPDMVEYAVEGVYFLSRSRASLASSCKANIAKALETYRIWQRSKPGRDINPTKLISLVEQAGAKRLELAAPTFRALDVVEVARETLMSLQFGGYEDD